MKESKKVHECCEEKVTVKKCRCYNQGGSGVIYGLGIFGALFYFLQNATDFVSVVIGIGKAIFWPAFAVFKVLAILQL